MNLDKKLELAHEWVMKHGKANTIGDRDSAVEYAWQYADAMEAEYNKRKQAEDKNKREAVRKLLDDNGTFIEREGHHFDDVADVCKTYTIPKDWQPDWSVAPDAVYWAVDADGSANFFRREPEITNNNGWDFGGVMQSNRNHNYRGDWKDSLRKRPNT